MVNSRNYRKQLGLDITAFFLMSAIVFIGILSGWKAGALLLSLSLCSIVSLLVTKTSRLKAIPSIIKIYFLLCLLAGFSCLYAIDISFSLDVLWKFLSVFFIMIFSYNYCNSLESLKKIILYFIINSFILSLYNIINYQPSIFRELPYGGVNPVALLMFLSILFSFILVHFKVKIILFSVPIFLYVLFLTESQKSIISLVIVLFIYLILYAFYIRISKSLSYLFIGVVIIFFGIKVLSVTEVFDSSLTRTIATFETLVTGEKVEGAAGGAAGEGLRNTLKVKGWGYFSDGPFIGYGLNNFRALYGHETNFYTYSHFTPIELGIGMGFLAILFYYSIYIILLKRSFRLLIRYKQSIYILIIGTTIAITLIGFYMQTYFDASVHFFLIIALSLTEIYQKESKLN